LCWHSLLRLFHSKYSQVRWQVYDVLGYAGSPAIELLMTALDDPDAYARRRALLALVRLCPLEQKSLAKKFANDPDSYNRSIAKQLEGEAGFVN
jgi:HEAT repeat protein